MHLTKGHTDGDTVVFFEKSKVVSMGDLYFAGMYPIFHLEHQGSLQGLVQNIARILNQTSPEFKFVPGHGPLSKRADLEDYYQMIVASLTTVNLQMKAGRTLAQILKKGLDAKWEGYSHGYLTTDKWLTLVYNGLQK